MDLSSRVTHWWLFFSVPVFLGLAVFFIYSSFLSTTTPAQEAKAQPATLDTKWYRVDTARAEYRRNATVVGNCHLCHAYWVPIPRTTQTSNPRFAHANITLNHGKNDRCYNCHHIADRNKFTDDDGATIMTQLPEKLCARCHGLIYNDWAAGTHGKWTGVMTAPGLFERTTYTCSECHDPHNPTFKYKTVAPAPTWPDKYIRTHGETDHQDPMANFLILKEPEEIF